MTAQPVFIDSAMYDQPIHIGVWLVLMGAAGIIALFVSHCIGNRPPVVLRMSTWGRVYVLQDTLNPKLVNVGMTRRTVHQRMAEVSENMAGGRGLVEVYAIHIPFVEAVERAAHWRLRRYQQLSERGTEWFRVDAQKGARAVNMAARDVRREGRRRRLWSAEADQDATAERKGRAQRLFG